MTEPTTEASAAASAPWLAPAIEQLRRARAQLRFPTGLLIQDERGAGGEAVARYAAQLALCREPHAPCGRCRDCRQFSVGQHPDFYPLHPIEDSNYIVVDQVRELAQQLALTAHGGGATVALISPADSLYRNAADALLKTLEEPRSNVTLILVASSAARLPATIASRCLRLRIPAPARAASVDWLQARRGPAPWPVVLEVLGDAPFEALQVDAPALARLKADTDRGLTDIIAGHGDIVANAERWTKGDPSGLRLACVETWITARIDEAASSRRQSPELRSSTHLPESGSDMNIASLLRLLEGLYELRRLRLTSVNRSLLLEQLLWQLRRVRAADAVQVRAER
jgi:DNA polymerase-3 subunit delta'